jgi:hypothetical protein
MLETPVKSIYAEHRNKTKQQNKNQSKLLITHFSSLLTISTK